MYLTADARALTVLADPTRTRIVELIRGASDGRALVGQLAEQLGLRQPTVSHHMAALLTAGIVVREADGRRAWYSIAHGQDSRVAAMLGAPVASTDEPDWTRVVDDLAERYRGVFSRETVARCLDDSRDLLGSAGDQPLLASRAAAFTTARLDDLDRVTHHSPTTPAVLFVCVKNAGRSQLAAGIMRQLAGSRVIVRTAGTAPAAGIRSTIATALDEIGVGLDGEFPKPLTDEAVQTADVVVTLGCGDACPVYPGRRYLDWDVADPARAPMSNVRDIRDDLHARVRGLLAEMLAASPAR